MRIKDLVKLTNKYLAGEQLVYAKLAPLFDAVIDDINSALNSTYPTFTSQHYENIDSEKAEYSFFPDNYIRTVVAVGAAHKFYEVDEEGMSADVDFKYKYAENLFYMQRDFIGRVPPFYQSESKGGLRVNETYDLYKTPYDFRIW